MKKVPVTVILLTLNEEFHLPGVLENIQGWAEEIFIVDSCSTDRTVDIALQYGVKIVQRKFTNFGDQWNFALKSLPIKTPWTFKLDPDERLTDELKEEIRTIVSNDTSCCGFSMCRRLWFMGCPLHIKASVLRLWRTGSCRFSDVIVNEHPLVEGDVGFLKGVMEHFDSRDLNHWVDKQNRYSTMEAIARYQKRKLSVKPKLLGSPLQRRMFLKQVFFYVPFRYQIQCLHEVFWRGAWRSGRAGIQWARLRVEVRRMRELKFLEIRQTGRIPEIPKAPHGEFDERILKSELQTLVCNSK